MSARRSVRWKLLEPPHWPWEPLRHHMAHLKQACISACHAGSRHSVCVSPSPGSMLGWGGWRGMYRINIWTEILFFSLFLGASGACRPGSSAVFGAPLPRGGFSLLRLFFSPVAARVPPPFHRVAAIFSAPRCQASTKLSNQQMSLYRSPTPHAQSALYASFILAIYNLFLLSDDGYYYPSETSSHIGNVLGGGYRDSLAQHFEFI